MPVRLEEISISGYRSIRDLREFRPGPLTVVTGMPGSGKSNFANFFLMLNFMMNGNLQSFISYNGGAGRVLHQGIPPLNAVNGSICVSTEKGVNDYEFTLVQKDGKYLVVSQERQRFCAAGKGESKWFDLSGGARESRLGNSGSPTQKVLKGLLLKFVVHHFSDIPSAMRTIDKAQKAENRYLRTDGANLGPFLRKVRTDSPDQYQRILTVLRDLLPGFDSFVFDEAGRSSMVRWKEKDSGIELDVFQASPGTLRLMSLVALLIAHSDDQAAPLIIDDVEMLVDFRALEVLALLMKEAAEHGRQIFVTTKSPQFIRYFSPGQVLMTTRGSEGSNYQYLGNN